MTEHQLGQRSFTDYLEIIARRKWVAIVPLVLVPLVAYLFSAQQSTVYASSADVLLTRQDLGSTLSGITNADVFTDPDRFAETQASLARVPEVAERAVERARIRDYSAGDLLDNSDVTPRGNADLLGFTVRNGDPAAAGRLATSYAEAYTDYRLELDTATLATARTDLQKTMKVLEREGSVDTTLYRELAQKVQDLRTRELLQMRARVVKPAGLGWQVAPTPMRNAMLGGVLGLLLGLAAVALWEALDRRVRDEEEIHRALDLPLLGRIPAPRRQGLAMLEDPSDVDAEAVRRLRAGVEFANLDSRAKVIMISSAVASEGKTTTISNLAVALARGGNRVALVDLDLRKPMIGGFFGLELRPGLADVAIGRIELERALIQVGLPAPTSGRSRVGRRKAAWDPSVASEVGDLFVLPAGFLPASPGELVGTEAVAAIIDGLRVAFDYVLIDSPPLLTVSDAVTLSTRVDAVFVAIRLGLVNRTMLRDLARVLATLPTPKLGFVLTGVDASERYGYGSYAAPEPRSQARHQPAILTEARRSEYESDFEAAEGSRVQ